VVDVEQLEVEIERDFAQIDAHRELALAPFTEESRIDAAQNDLAGRPGPVSTTVMPGVKAASALTSSMRWRASSGADRADVDRRVLQGGGAAGGRHHDGVGVPARIGGAASGAPASGAVWAKAGTEAQPISMVAQ
jgi:hypothetical protein